MKKANKIIAVILIIISGFFFFFSMKFPESVGNEVGHAFFPKLLSVTLILLSIILFVAKEEDESAIFEFSNNQKMIFIIGAISLVIYVVAINILGFVISSAIYSIVWIYLMGNRDIKKFVVPLLFSIVISIVFEKMLGVVIPHGIIY